MMASVQKAFQHCWSEQEAVLARLLAAGVLMASQVVVLSTAAAPKCCCFPIQSMRGGADNKRAKNLGTLFSPWSSYNLG